MERLNCCPKKIHNPSGGNKLVARNKSNLQGPRGLVQRGNEAKYSI